MENKVIDIHIHFGSPKDEESGCYWSEEFTKSAAYFAMLLITNSLFKKINIHEVRKHMLKVINGSKYTDKSVVLAFDQVYDESGIVHPEKTNLFVPNRYIADLAKENSRVLFGSSVHPYRNDWRQELDYCLENRAVLCKWIPSAQLINPEHPKCIPFYKKLVEHQLPLLCHCGPEYSIPTSDDTYNEYNNPKYLRRALDEGVTVIIAHCSMPFWGTFDEEYHDDWDEFLKLFEKYEEQGWNLYADLSAVCTPFRKKYIEEIMQRVNKIPHERLLYGSDYPIPVFEITLNKSMKFLRWLGFILKVTFMSNLLDKNYSIIKEMGFDECIFTNASKLFEKIKY
jgi:predicted TIM-barrel fold metal-dependent hydrolase